MALPPSGAAAIATSAYIATYPRIPSFGHPSAQTKAMTKQLLCSTLFGLMLSGCSTNRTDRTERSSDRVEAGAKEAASKVKAEMADAKAAINRRLDALDEEIEKLEAKAKKASAKTRKTLEREVEELRAEGKKLRAEMSTWDEKTESAWRKTKQNVEEGLDKAESSIKKFWNDLTN